MKKFLSILAIALCVCLGAGAAAEEVPALLAHYTFDDAANLGADASGNGNDLVRTLNPDGIQAVEGVMGGGVYFGGSSGLAAADDSNNDFIDTYTGKSLTISYWAKVDTANAPGDQRRVVDAGCNGSADGFTNVLGINENGVFNIVCAGGTDWWSGYGAVDGDPAGWHHYVMVLDNDACTLTSYIDGVKKAEVYAEDENIASAFTFCVGGNWAQWDWFSGGVNTAQGFVGTVDEVKVYAGAYYDMEELSGANDMPLSTDPVTSYATYRFNGTVEEVTREEIVYHPTNGLTAWYEFNDAENIGKDSTGNGHDLNKQINGAGIGTAVGADGTGAVSFGGTSALVTSEESARDFVDQMNGGALTIDFYAENTAPGGSQHIINNGMNGSSDGFTFILNNESGRLGLMTPMGNQWWDTWGGAWPSSGTDANEFLKDWHRYTVVIDPEAGKVTTKINGNVAKEFAMNGTMNLTSGFSFALGGQWSQYDWFSGGDQAIYGFTGNVDNMKIFGEAIYDMETIDEAGLGEEKVTITDIVVTEFPTKGYVNNTVCVQGPAFKDFQNPVTGKWYTFLPIDLTVSGTTTYPLIGGSAWIIGDVTVTVDGDNLTVNYRYYNPALVEMPTVDVAQYLNFFSDVTAVTAEQLENGAETPFTFGNTYSIANDLGGAAKTNLYVNNIATFFDSNTALVRWYDGSAQQIVDALVEMAGLTETYTK